MMYVYAIGGFVMLFGGGEWLVRGAVSVSRRFGLSPLLIGMTVVAFCTSAPELVVSLDAALAGNSDIALGNVVGSNIFNVLGVLGASALIAPIVVRPVELRRDMAVMIGSAALLAGLVQAGVLGRTQGLLLLAGIVAYVWLSYRSEMRNPALPSAGLHAEKSEEIEAAGSLWAGFGLLGAGLASLIVGSRLLIVGATDIAQAAGVSDAVIGLTLVAVGTSLPELATSVVAAIRKHADVAVGNVVGSNIFNILGILGLTAVIRPIEVADQIAHVDVWIMLAVSIGLALFLLLPGRIGRIAGACFITGYIAYSAALLASVHSVFTYESAKWFCAR